MANQGQDQHGTAALLTLTVNGEDQNFSAPQTVASLLQLLGIAEDRVAVEMNKAIVRKRDWAQTWAPDGAQIEIVQFVGGG